MAKAKFILILFILLGIFYIVGADNDIQQKPKENITGFNNSTTETSVVQEHTSEVNTITASPVDTSYDIVVNDSGVAQTNVKIRQVSEQPVYTKFNNPTRIPDSALIQSVSSTADTTSYSKDGDIVKLTGEYEKPEDSVFFMMDYQYDAVYEKLSKNVTAVQIKTSDRASREVGLRINTSKPIISVTSQTETSYTVDNQTVVARGNGSVHLTIVYGNPEIQTENYAFIDGGSSTFVSEINTKSVHNEYQIARGVLGFERAEHKVPVVIQPDSEFDTTSENGRERAGIVYIPDSVASDKSVFYKTLAHETTHALNNQISGNFPTWFEEGTAEHVEAVDADYRGSVYVRPFVEEQYYPSGCQSAKQQCLIYYSGTSYEELHNYLSSQETFMNDARWSDSRTSFRYSFSALFIDAVVTNEYNNSSMSELYDSLRDDTLRLRNNSYQDQIGTHILNLLNKESVSVCEGYLSSRNLSVSTETVRDCVEYYDNTPQYPESLSSKYSVVETNVTFVEAKRP